MPMPVSMTVDHEAKQLYVLYSDGSVYAISTVREPHRPDPEWVQVAPPNPSAVVEELASG